MMRFLIIKTSSFGDVVQTFPVIHFLRKRYPSCHIDWVVEERIAPLVSSHPDIHRVIPINTKKYRKKIFSKETRLQVHQAIQELREDMYDVVFDFQANIKSFFIQLIVRAKERVGFGFKTASEKIGSCLLTKRFNPPLGQNIRRDYLFIVQSYFGESTEQAPIEIVSLNISEEEKALLEKDFAFIDATTWIICPASIWENKKLEPTTLVAFLKKSVDRFQPKLLFLSGNDQERKEAEWLKSACGGVILHQPSFPLLQHAMKKAGLVISVDSFPLHLAATTGVKTLSFFGPSSKNKYAPEGDLHGSFQGECPYGKTFEKRCPILRTCPTGACSKKIEVSSLLELLK